MDDLVHQNTVSIRLGVKVQRGVIIGRAYHLKMDYSNENLNETYLSPDQIKSLPKLMVASMELVASMPLHFLEFLGKQTLGRNRLTRWVQAPKKWNQCLKKSAEINTRYSMQTLRNKSLLSQVGLNREVGGTIGNVVFEVTYTKLPQKGKTNLSSKNKPIIYYLNKQQKWKYQMIQIMNRG